MLNHSRPTSCWTQTYAILHDPGACPNLPMQAIGEDATVQSMLSRMTFFAFMRPARSWRSAKVVLGNQKKADSSSRHRFSKNTFQSNRNNETTIHCLTTSCFLWLLTPRLPYSLNPSKLASESDSMMNLL